MAIVYDVQYEGDVEPDSDGWALVDDDHSSSDGDILTIDTSANAGLVCSYSRTPDVDFDAGVYVKFRIRINSSISNGFIIKIDDGTQNEKVRLHLNTTTVYDIVLGEVGSIDLTSYVVFGVYIKDTTAKVYTNGSLFGSFEVYSQAADDLINFGDSSDSKGADADLDYFYYALDLADDPDAPIDNAILFGSNF